MMPVFNYPAPYAPSYKEPQSVEDCLTQARMLVKQEYDRAALGPIVKGDNILIVTLPDQNRYVKEAVIEACKEAGANKVTFIYIDKFTGQELPTYSVEDGWEEVDYLKRGVAAGSHDLKDSASGLNVGDLLREYLNKHPEYTKLFWDLGGRSLITKGLKEHGSKFKGNWMFNNWEEFLSRAWTFPDELTREIEKRIVQYLGSISEVRITDPEGTFLEYSLTSDEAKRFEMNAWKSGHLFLDPLQATSAETSTKATPFVSPDVSPVFTIVNGVLAGTATHKGFIPRIELHFESGRLVEVKEGGKYGDGIKEMLDKYKHIQWPGYPDKGLMWFCDNALCTLVKSFRRTSDMFNSYWRYPNLGERNRAGVFHLGFGSRRHANEHLKYAEENKVPIGHIHIHNYFTTFEIKLRGSENWYKIVDKGWVTAMSDPEIRALATKYGDPDHLLSYDWVPPLPGINCEGNYMGDYAHDPISYLKKRMNDGKTV